MFFLKNLPKWERALRVLIGLVVILAGIFYPMTPSWVGWVVIASGATFAITGFVGFCPMCAMVGRKLKNPS